MRTASGKFNVWTHMATGKRPYQEDSAAVLAPGSRCLLTVADGMGGHESGDIASREFLKGMHAQAERLEAISAEVAKRPAPPVPLEDNIWPRLTPAQLGALQQAMVSCAEAGLVALRQTDEARLHPDMGTTLTAAWCWGHEVVWAQVGDSRLYHLAAGGECARQVTKDQCWPYPNENVLRRSCGADPELFGGLLWDAESLGSFVVQPGDVLILCSDGVSGYVDPDPVRAKKNRWPSAGLPPGLFLGQRVRSGPLENAAQELVNCADNMGGHDNMTALVLEVL